MLIHASKPLDIITLSHVLPETPIHLVRHQAKVLAGKASLTSQGEVAVHVTELQAHSTVPMPHYNANHFAYQLFACLCPLLHKAEYKYTHKSMHKCMNTCIVPLFQISCSQKASGCSLLLTYVQMASSFHSTAQKCSKHFLFSLFSDLAL